MAQGAGWQEKIGTNMKSGGETTMTVGYLSVVEGRGTTFVISIVQFNISSDLQHPWSWPPAIIVPPLLIL